MPVGLARIKDAGDDGGEILDLDDLVVRLEQIGSHCFQIQPFVWGTLERPVIEVETVNVDECPHLSCLKKSRGRRSDPAPQVETIGVVNERGAGGRAGGRS